LGLRTSGPGLAIEFLSEGNRQQVVVGRALALEPAVLPIGRTAILVSSELDELAAVLGGDAA